MIIRHIGHAEFLMETEKGMRIVTDPYDEGCGYPVQRIKTDSVLVSHGHHDHNAVDTLEGVTTVIDKAGEYTPAPGVRVTAVTSFHDDEKGSKRGETLLFLVDTDGLRIVHLGDLGCMPEEEQIRLLAKPDVLMIPVGGFYTINGKMARKVAEKLQPRVTLPMHYKTKYNAEWPISGPDVFLDRIGNREILLDAEILRITAGDLECQPDVVLFRQ